MSGDKKVSQLGILGGKPAGADLFPFVNLESGETMAVSYDNIIGGDGIFTGAPVRTIYSRSNVVSYTSGSSGVDLLFGSEGSTYGSRFITGEFFSGGNFLSKMIYFRAFGKFSSNTGSVNVSIMVGDDLILGSNIGQVTLSQPQGHPFEIFGEVVFNGNGVVACYSIGHCANNGDFKRYPLSDPTSSQNITGFSGGDFKLIFSSSTLSLNSYGGYIQVLS
jgi:hypothetical protein